MVNILVIDDDTNFLNYMVTMLSREGFNVVGAGDGYTGIALCLEHKPEVVITDICMPQKDGLATIHDLKEEFPELKIIAVSGWGYSHPGEYLPKAERLGAEYSFIKPFDREDFLAAVKDLAGMTVDA
ncbi:MAG: response regulator [Proteobacteria bacterium]|nr:response regulator [Pseudomonadota bacterium]MBU1686110.1 response regulator [Pseudomonadota bacterium]